MRKISLPAFLEIRQDDGSTTFYSLNRVLLSRSCKPAASRSGSCAASVG
jgi:hypothetical protein